MSRTAAAAAIACLIAAAAGRLHAQIPGRNVNMVSGNTLPEGDPFLQRQNEPSIAASTRNPLHLLGGSNDYRTVDLPGLPDGQETGDAWLGLYKSTDGGQRWKSTLVPGYPQDQSIPASPLKGYQAAADPVVRAGTSGLFYYAGLVFNRTDEKSAIFVARFIDNNNTENGDPIAYLGTKIVASSPGTRFLDKPWIAVDIPRGGATCAIPAPNGATQRIPAGAVYASWSSITGTGAALKSQILLTRSLDCGATWSTPSILSRPQDQINQGSTIAIDPRTGAVIVAWRRFATPGATDGDALTVARSVDFGKKWDPPSEAHRFPKRDRKMTLPPWVFEHRGKDKDRDDYEDDERELKKNARPVKFRGAQVIDPLAAFDEPSGSDRFRTNGYPTVAIDEGGRVYIAWTERGFSTIPGRTSPVDGDAKIVMTTSGNGVSWRAPLAVSDTSQPGHQFMPSLTFAGGKLLLIYYDLRDDVSRTLSQFADDTTARPSGHRRTMDIRASMAAPAPTPVFAPSVKISDYAMGSRPGSSVIEQMQYNPPNLPMFRLGTVPFIGDYIDVAPAPAFVPDGRGGWAYNTAAGSTLPVFQAVWTDNRDVRAPRDGNWTHYTPPFSAAHNPVNGAVCDPGFTASRNQNIYTSRITGGLLVGSPGNTKPLSPILQRAFVVFAQNTTDVIKTFRLTIAAQPVGGHASFSQFTPAAAPLTSIDVTTAPRSMAARTVYATSSNPLTQIKVDVREIATIGGLPTPSGLQASILLNPDIQNPDIQNPDIQNTGIVNPDIQNAEVHNPDIQNPDIQNPDIQNPDIQNPDIQNPDIQNVVLANPDIQNPDIQNPDIQNPDIQNPDIQNPDIQNPDIQNGALTDVTWTMTNTGNTTTAYNVNLFLTSAQVPAGFKFQLVLHKTYTTPVSLDCELKTQTQNVLVASIRNPQFADPSSTQLLDQNDPRLTNPTLWLAPGEIGKITLRIIDPDRSNNVTTPDGVSVDPAFDPHQAVVTPILVAQPVGTPEAALGQTRPPIVTPNNSSILFLTQPAASNIGQPISPAVRVQVRDASGAVVPGVAVTLALGNNPGGATLIGGGAALSNVNGIATFGGLSLDTIGTGYTLVASVGVQGILPSTSTPFDVKGVVVSVSGTAGGTDNVNFHDGAAGAQGTVPMNTSVFVPAGKAVTVSASGVWSLGAPTGPAGNGGLGGSEFLVPDGPSFGLFGRIGADGPWQFIGNGPATLTAAGSGFLELAMNDDFYGDNGGAITATIVPPAGSPALVVVNAADSGPGSLRAAITAANAAATPQGIAFRIPGEAPFVILPQTPLPSLTRTTVIDGSTQPGFAGAPLVAVSGAALGESAQGIVIAATAPASTLRALTLQAFSGTAATLLSAGNQVYGLFVGTDTSGQAAAGNVNGVVVNGDANRIGGILPSERNTVSGNQQGVWVQGGAGNTVQGNLIGTNADGRYAIGNSTGMLVGGGTDTTIGGTSALTANVIANSTANGVKIAGAGTQRVSVRRNSIRGNGLQGIDLGGDGPTANDPGDADNGPNGLQNFPVIASAYDTGAVAFSLDSAAGSYVVDFYSTPTCGQGAVFIGSTTAGNGGPSSIALPPMADGTLVTATATDASGSTSEFSACATVTAVPPPPPPPPPGPTQWKIADGGNGAFYRFVPTHITATAAEAACVADGGHLASIHSLAENHFASMVIDPGGVGGITAFLGGRRIDGWDWRDGTPFDYTTWRAGEPSGDGTVIQMWPDNNGSNSGWNDVPDAVFPDIGYLCKFPPPLTLAGPAGGDGGTPFAAVDCPLGSAVIGFTGQAGDDIDRTSLACAPLPALSPVSSWFVAGGTGGSDYGSALMCGAGEAATGVYGASRGWIDYLGVICTNLTTGATSRTASAGLDQGGSQFTVSCPAGAVVTGVEGRQGLLLDQITLRCR